MTIERAKQITASAIAAHDADSILVAADAAEEAGCPLVAEALRWRSREVRDGSTFHSWEW